MNKQNIPTFIYGTAWKEARTAELVETAIKAGFRAVDTANQPRHYSEPLVGKALVNLADRGFTRDEIFLQTKFTLPDGQDERIPYDPNASLNDQVQQSFASSLVNLQTDYLDSYLLHGPHTGRGLLEEDWQVWNAIEDIYKSGKAKMIGVSNVSAGQLELLTQKAKIKPMLVQNRCFAEHGWDYHVRNICRLHGIVYQGFSLLTANVHVLHDQRVQEIAKRLGRTPMQVIFCFARQIGMVPLTGTTNEQHMKEDLQMVDFELSADELQMIEKIG